MFMSCRFTLDKVSQSKYDMKNNQAKKYKQKYDLIIKDAIHHLTKLMIR